MDKEQEYRAYCCGYLAGFIRAFRKIKEISEFECKVDERDIEEDYRKYLNVVDRRANGKN